MLFHKIRKTMTCVAGTVSENTERVRGITTLIYIAPTAANTTWNITFTDADGDPVYYKKNQTGTLRDREPIDMWGIYTITISSLSKVDEVFVVKINLDERISI